MTAFRNIITPDFYSFLASNKRLYGKAVFDQINDASEKIAISPEEQDSLAVVLSGHDTGITNGGENIGFLQNQPKNVTFGSDGLVRREVKFRSIDALQYSTVMQDFTAMLESPLDPNMSAGRRDYLISLHPSAYTIVGEFQTNPMPYGTIVIVRKIGTEFIILENVSAPMISSNRAGIGGSTEYSYDSSKDGDLERKFNLKRRKGKYWGILTQYHDKLLSNGSLPNDMLRVPDTTFWEPMGTGGGAILIDYIPSFHAMCAAFYNHFGKKLRSSGIRSFKQQIINRQKSLPVSKGGTKKETAACKTLNQRGAGCGTAIPGRSNHGWGQAVDIRTPEGVKCVKTACFISAATPYYKWLIENAYAKGFEGIKWGHLGQKGTILASQKFEAWHWEPITGRVIKGL